MTAALSPFQAPTGVDLQPGGIASGRRAWRKTAAVYPRAPSRRSLAVASFNTRHGLSFVHLGPHAGKHSAQDITQQLHSLPSVASRNGAPSSEQVSPEFRTFQPDSGAA